HGEVDPRPRSAPRPSGPYWPRCNGGKRDLARPPGRSQKPPTERWGLSHFLRNKKEPAELTGADMVLEALEREGVEYIFGYPGGANLPIYQHLREHPKLKHILVTKIDQLPRVIHEAFHIATTGRPGPVLIDICKDVQQAEAERVNTEYLDLPGYRLNGHVDLDLARQAARALARAERPVILAGHGVLLSHAERELMQLAEAAAAPVGTTLLGIGAFPVKHPLSLHMTGFMGTGWCL